MGWKWFLCTDYLEEVGINLDEGVDFFDVFISVLPIAPLWMSNLLQFWVNVFLFDMRNRRIVHRHFLPLDLFCPFRLIISIVIFFLDFFNKDSLILGSSLFLFVLLGQVIVHATPKIR